MKGFSEWGFGKFFFSFEPQGAFPGYKFKHIVLAVGQNGRFNDLFHPSWREKSFWEAINIYCLRNISSKTLKPLMKTGERILELKAKWINNLLKTSRMKHKCKKCFSRQFSARFRSPQLLLVGRDSIIAQWNFPISLFYDTIREKSTIISCSAINSMRNSICYCIFNRRFWIF